jgi:hypothetical protein
VDSTKYCKKIDGQTTNKIIGTKKKIDKNCMIPTMVMQISHNPFFLLIVIVLWHFLSYKKPPIFTMVEKLLNHFSQKNLAPFSPPFHSQQILTISDGREFLTIPLPFPPAPNYSKQFLATNVSEEFLMKPLSICFLTPHLKIPFASSFN